MLSQILSGTKWTGLMTWYDELKYNKFRSDPEKCQSDKF